MGLEDGRIPDSSLSASSEYNSWHGAKNARLNNNRGATVWMAAKHVAGEYIQVDLGEKFVLTGVATQGRNKTDYPQYISKYYVGYSSDGKNFHNVTDNSGKLVMFRGYNHASANNLPAINARYFRLYTHEWVRKVCTQLELYGCQVRNCLTENGGCSEKCIQVNEGVVMCGCNKPGYKLVHGVCQDIDECTEDRPCDHNCKNTNGSYVCSCRNGYTLGRDGKSCDDINECRGNHTCDQLCYNTPGSYRCRCKPGYKFGPDSLSRKCIDIDECTAGTSGCEHLCNNTIGSFKCSCRHGYKLGLDRKSCAAATTTAVSRGTTTKERKTTTATSTTTATTTTTAAAPRGTTTKERKTTTTETTTVFAIVFVVVYVNVVDFVMLLDRIHINECQYPYSHKCEQICLNKNGGYTCKCRQGYTLAQDGYGCDDINECKKNNGHCSDNCTNTIGSYICTCPNGFKLKLDDRTCEDVNECQQNNGGCLHFCKNEVGKYRCECRAGYRLMSDGYSCKDIDECAEISPCDAISMNCVNTVPSYRCDCKPGFEPMSGNSAACQ
ncbi:EGF-like domain-containing, partial [Paramuricea clavata]